MERIRIYVYYFTGTAEVQEELARRISKMNNSMEMRDVHPSRKTLTMDASTKIEFVDSNSTHINEPCFCCISGSPGTNQRDQ